MKKRCLAEKDQFSKDLVISDEILTFIANEFKSSIRDMLGVLNRIIASSRIQNKNPSLQDAKLILKDLFSNMNTLLILRIFRKL